MVTKLKMKFPVGKLTMILLAGYLLVGCGKTKTNNNELTEEEKKAGWQLLFDGRSTDGWHVYNQGKIPSAWIVKDSTLHCSPNPELEHGDLLTDKAYENYDLRFEWQITAGGNSGVFVNVSEQAALPTAWTSGPEYQLLEDSHHDFSIPTKRSGCLYGFKPQENPASTKKTGEWNESRIVQENGKLSFYLNGVLTASQDLKSDGWKKMIQESNFKSFPEFGKYTSGHIALQDWMKGISFRNIKIKEL